MRALTQDAIKTLELGVKGKLGDDTATTRLMAAQAILDRGWGKPPQAVEVVAGYKDAEPLLPHMTEDEVLERLLAKRAERARNVTPERAAIERRPGKGERDE